MYRLFKQKKEKTEESEQNTDEKPSIEYGGEEEGEEDDAISYMENQHSVLDEQFEIFDKSFINYFMSHIHLKVYDFTES